jgi:psiF repeat
MKQLIAAMICALFALGTAHAQDKAETKKAATATTEKVKKEPSEAQKKQQERMKDCNVKAEGKSGDERKKFMSSCLKGEESSDKKEPSAAQKKQQERMKDCSAKAEGKSGDDRKKFMSSCLKS